MIFPRVKKETVQHGVFSLTGTLSFYADDHDASVSAFNLLTEFCRDLEIRVKRADEKTAVLHFQKIKDKRYGFYRVHTKTDGIFVQYTSAGSARDAAATLVASGIYDDAKKELSFTCGKIEDWPDAKYRGVMLDPARLHIDLDLLRARIRLMARAKLNVLHLHLLDNERYAIRSEAVPSLNENPIFKQYGIQEMRELVAYAKGLGVTILPEIDYPGHALFTLEKMPELKCESDGERIGIWTLCLANEGTYDLLERLIAEISDIFPSEYVHIGGDEFSFSDILDQYPGYEYAWDKCDHCKKEMAEKECIDVYDYFCHYLKRVHAIAAKYNKKIMLWSDSIDISRTNDLPRDILIQFWRIALPGRGPYEGCSMQRFLDEGFTVVNNFFEESYLDDYVTEERLKNWDISKSPSAKNNLEHLVGGSFCAWGFRDHFEYTLPAALFLFGDRFWNRAPLEINREATAAMSRQLIWTEKGVLDIFGLLGGCLMPVRGDDRYLSPSDDVEAVKKAITYLERVYMIGRCDQRNVKAYIHCLKDLLKTGIKGR
ncbi:MAG: family 20 glycosylhydrolase [Spirochaetaceae bacterium]|jgi:hypothetical protein|nr:family 20 glycosylhydrolase [Spirochaetaceae bacterium]